MEPFSLSSLVGIMLLVLSLACCIVYITDKSSAKTVISDTSFSTLQNTFLHPLYLALFSEWLHGPYVYMLYRHYGFNEAEIAILYLVGYFIAIPCGPVIGLLADKYGRKKMVVGFFILFTLCSLVKLSPNYYVLLFGRVLGGISTIILNSVFESWYIHEHTIRNSHPIEWLSWTLSKATFVNGVLAIIAGLLAQLTSEWMNLGPVSPFVIPVPFLLIAMMLVFRDWKENYGEKEAEFWHSFRASIKTIMTSKKLFLLGVIQSLLESSMFVFVFLWTPVLEPGKPPLGFTYASFMVSFMIGSSIYSIILKRNVKSEAILPYCFVIMALSFAVCAVTSIDNQFKNQLVYVSYVSFLLIELAIGIYYPCIGRVRGEAIPSNLRANIMTWYRVPTNVITCVLLIGLYYATQYEFKHFANPIIFGLCVVSSLVGWFVARHFTSLLKNSDNDDSGANDRSVQLQITSNVNQAENASTSTALEKGTALNSANVEANGNTDNYETAPRRDNIDNLEATSSKVHMETPPSKHDMEILPCKDALETAQSKDDVEANSNTGDIANLNVPSDKVETETSSNVDVKGNVSNKDDMEAVLSTSDT